MLIEGLVGIVTGIITTSLIFLIKSFWISKVTPFIKETRYQGVLINGAWSTGQQDPIETQTNLDFEGDNSTDKIGMRLFLDQSAHELTGTFTLTRYRLGNPPFTCDFKVRGNMWEGYITLNFLPKDRRITSYGTALLKLSDAGSELNGKYCFRNIMNESVDATSMILFREETK